MAKLLFLDYEVFCFLYITMLLNVCPIDNSKRLLYFMHIMNCQRFQIEGRKFGKHRNGLQRFRCIIAARPTPKITLGCLVR